MIKLLLDANDESQQIIKRHLEENASEVLAEKINNGIVIEKDGKRLISKKTLNGFMKFASDEARKLADKGARSACIKSDTVFGWAIHYFEEDSIAETLYTPDGKEVKPVPQTAPKAAPAPVPKKKDNPQMSLFGMFESANTETELPMTEIENDEEAEIEDEQNPKEEPKRKIADFYLHYRQLEEKYSDGIVLYRLGDFYEIFGANAVKISDELNLTLTGRDVGLPERVPMTGLPYHAVDIYIAKLIERGFKVIIAVGEHTAERVIERPETSEIAVDEETGEVLAETPQEGSDELDELDISAFDSEAVALLYDRLGDEIALR